MGKPVGGHRKRIAGRDVAVRRQTFRAPQLGIVQRGDANEDACLPRQILRRITRILQRPPGAFQQKALLRVHPLGLDGRDLEEGCIKTVHIIQKTAMAGKSGLSQPVRISGRVAPQRHVGRQVSTGQKLVVEGLHIRSPWEPSGHADDRDPIVRHLRFDRGMRYHCRRRNRFRPDDFFGTPGCHCPDRRLLLGQL